MHAFVAHATGMARGSGVPTAVRDEEPLHGAVQLVRCALVGQTEEIENANLYPLSLDGAYTEASAVRVYRPRRLVADPLTKGR